MVSLLGDGTYLFSVPSVTRWMARRCGTPTLAVICDNGAGGPPSSPPSEFTRSVPRPLA